MVRAASRSNVEHERENLELHKTTALAPPPPPEIKSLTHTSPPAFVRVPPLRCSLSCPRAPLVVVQRTGCSAFGLLRPRPPATRLPWWAQLPTPSHQPPTSQQPTANSQPCASLLFLISVGAACCRCRRVGPGLCSAPPLYLFFLFFFGAGDGSLWSNPRPLFLDFLFLLLSRESFLIKLTRFAC